MSHAPTLGHPPKWHANLPHAALHGSKKFYGVLSGVTAAALIAGITATLASRGPAPSREQQAAMVASMPAPLDAPAGASVPDAGTVFGRKHMTTEEPGPTF